MFSNAPDDRPITATEITDPTNGIGVASLPGGGTSEPAGTVATTTAQATGLTYFQLYGTSYKFTNQNLSRPANPVGTAPTGYAAVSLCTSAGAKSCDYVAHGETVTSKKFSSQATASDTSPAGGYGYDVVTLSQFARPSETRNIGDWAKTWTEKPSPYFFHPNGTTIGYMDGHAKFLTAYAAYTTGCDGDDWAWTRQVPATHAVYSVTPISLPPYIPRTRESPPFSAKIEGGGLCAATGNKGDGERAEKDNVLKWSRVRLVLSIVTCEGLWATLLERVQFVPGAAPKKSGAVPRETPPGLPRFFDYAGALHIHSTYSDGTGTVAEIAHAANRAGLDFVVLCDHSNLDALGGGQDGWHGRTLVLVGTEITTDTGHLLALRVPPGFVPAPDAASLAQQAILDAGGIGFIALPCDLKDHWRDFGARRPGIGLEVFNLSAIARAKISLPALALVWKRYHSTRPLRAFNLVAARPGRELRLWDSLTAPVSGEDVPRPVVGIASVDAHAVMKFGGRAYPFPTYEEVFRTLRTHVVTSGPLSYGEGSIQNGSADADTACVHEALRAGHCYMAYDNYADAAGFFFEARADSLAAPALMGDSLTFQDGQNAASLVAQAPRTRSIIRLYWNGKLVASARGGRLEYRVSAPGAYRAEVFLYSRRLGNWCLGARPWIFSNPIYVQPVPVPAGKKTSAAPQTSNLEARS